MDMQTIDQVLSNPKVMVISDLRHQIQAKTDAMTPERDRRTQEGFLLRDIQRASGELDKLDPARSNAEADARARIMSATEALEHETDSRAREYLLSELSQARADLEAIAPLGPKEKLVGDLLDVLLATRDPAAEARAQKSSDLSLPLAEQDEQTAELIADSNHPMAEMDSPTVDEFAADAEAAEKIELVCERRSGSALIRR
jgi:hypothetical protein